MIKLRDRVRPADSALYKTPIKATMFVGLNHTTPSAVEQGHNQYIHLTNRVKTQYGFNMQTECQSEGDVQAY